MMTNPDLLYDLIRSRQDGASRHMQPSQRGAHERQVVAQQRRVAADLRPPNIARRLNHLRPALGHLVSVGLMIIFVSVMLNGQIVSAAHLAATGMPIVGVGVTQASA